jgi:hypothetical protein
MKDRGRGHGAGVIGKMKNRSTKLQERIDFRATLAKFFNNTKKEIKIQDLNLCDLCACARNQYLLRVLRALCSKQLSSFMVS